MQISIKSLRRQNKQKDLQLNIRMDKINPQKDGKTQIILIKKRRGHAGNNFINTILVILVINS